jgi:hypothetical protein
LRVLILYISWALCGARIKTLIPWLDRQIDHRHIRLGESAELLHRILHGLLAEWGIEDLGVLAVDRF